MLIETSDTTSAIAPALVAAQSELACVYKTGENTFDRYRYATLDDYVKAATPILAAHDLAAIFSVMHDAAHEERKTAKGGLAYSIRVAVRCRLIHASGEWIECSGCGEGIDRADKGTYKGITGARKYLLAQMLNLGTTDDPEEARATQREETPEDRHAAVAEAIRGVEKWTGTTDPEVVRGHMFRIASKVVGELNGGLQSLTAADYRDLATYVERHSGKPYQEVLA